MGDREHQSFRRFSSLAARSDLHAVHGLPELVQLVGGAQGLQTDVRQLHLFVPQLAPKLHHRLRVIVSALRDPADDTKQQLQMTKSQSSTRTLRAKTQPC